MTASFKLWALFELAILEDTCFAYPVTLSYDYTLSIWIGIIQGNILDALDYYARLGYFPHCPGESVLACLNIALGAYFAWLLNNKDFRRTDTDLIWIANIALGAYFAWLLNNKDFRRFIAIWIVT